MTQPRTYIRADIQPKLDIMRQVSGIRDYSSLLAQFTLMFGDEYIARFSTTPDTTPTQPPPHQRNTANTAATATKNPVLGTLPTATTFTEPIQL